MPLAVKVSFGNKNPTLDIFFFSIAKSRVEYEA